MGALLVVGIIFWGKIIYFYVKTRRVLGKNEQRLKDIAVYYRHVLFVLFFFLIFRLAVVYNSARCLT